MSPFAERPLKSAFSRSLAKGLLLALGALLRLLSLTAAEFPFRNPELPLEQRVDDLLARMTLEEKIGQMCLLDGRREPLERLRNQSVGGFLQVLGNEVEPILEANAETRLAIPLLFGIDAIHGHAFWPGATVFPTQLTLAATWHPELLEQVGEITREEMWFTGVNWTFSPVLGMARDLRWGRVGETFGEDLLLNSTLGASLIHGYQGEDLRDGILATAKHYAGYSETQGGRDASEADLSRRKLRAWFFPPFQRAVEAGVGAMMTGYQSIDGQPSTANAWLLRDVLRDEWGFGGVVVTDWDNVGRMVWEQRVSPDYVTAAAQAIAAGNDIVMATPRFYKAAIQAVEEGQVNEAFVDEAVRRILRVKFALGLFENPRRPDLARAAEVIGTAEHRAVALEAAREAIVLLRNDGLLPLSGSGKRIAVVGPNADDALALLGDWSLGTGQANNRRGARHPAEAITTIREGMETVFHDVVFAPGCRLVAEDGMTRDAGLELIPEAIEAAESADVVVAVVGDQLPFYGERKSVATLELQGGQIELLEALVETGRLLVVVVQSSKPLVLPPTVVNRANAILWAGCPGMLGGQAVAEIIAGRQEPEGRLPLSWPKHVGQQPIFYSQIRGQHGDTYADLDQSPLFAFGEGLSYSTVEYSALEVITPEIRAGGSVKARVSVENTGSRPTTEVVQVYVSDLVTSVTWVDRRLVAFKRLELAQGERRIVEFEIPSAALSIVDLKGKRIVESGDFELRVGRSSRRETQVTSEFYVVTDR